MKKGKMLGTSGDALLLTLIKLVTTVLGFVITRLLSQYLSVYDYGTYSQILLIVSTLNAITILGMMDGVNYFYCSERNPQMREAYISSIFALQCIVSAIAGSIVMLLSEPLCVYLDNPDIRKLMIFAVVLPFLQNLLFMFQVLLVAVGKAKMLAVRNLVVSLARLAAVILVILVVQNVAVILMTTLVLDVAQILFFGWTLKKSNCLIRLSSVNTKLFRRILQYCIPMAVYISVKAINRDVDKYLIALVTDPETLAVYANASKALPFDIIVHSFQTVLVPEVTRRVTSEDHEGSVSLYKVFLEINYVATLVPCCAALAAAPQLMQLLYSDKYMSGLPVFCVYILVDLLQFTNITLILSAAGKTKTLMTMGIGAMLVNTVLNYLFYRWMGLIGPAIVTFLVTLMTGLLMLHLSARELKTNIAAFFDLKFLLGFLLENLAAAVILFRVQQWLRALGGHYFVILVLICGVYCGAFLLLHGKRLLRDMRWLDKASAKRK